MTAYDWAFRHAAVRVDAEKAHHAGFAADPRRAGPCSSRRGDGCDATCRR